MLQAKGELRDRINDLDKLLQEGEKRSWSIPVEYDRKQMSLFFAKAQALLTSVKGCVCSL